VAINEDDVMKAYIVSYDLRSPGRNYNPLYEAIKLFPQWGKVTESLWVVVANDDAASIRDRLRRLVDSNDRIFVLRSGTEAAWVNSICDNEWLKRNL